MSRAKTGGGVGTNGSRVRGRSVRADISAGRQHPGAPNMSGLAAESLVDAIRSAAKELDPSFFTAAEIPAAVLRKLARDPSATVRRAMAESESTPTNILQILADDPAPVVRACVAGNINAPSRTLKRLAQERGRYSASVRDAAMQNPELPMQALGRLAQHSSRVIRQEAKRELARRTAGSHNAEVIREWASPRNPTEHRIAAASNLFAPPDVVRRLSKDRSPVVREEAADLLRRRAKAAQSASTRTP